MRINVIGAGPAGCATALALSRRLGGNAKITVYERDELSRSGGFGVVLPALPLARMIGEGHDWAADLRTHARAWNQLAVVKDGVRSHCEGHPLLAISRRRLLDVLRQRMELEGITVRFGREIQDPTAMVEADLIVAADGLRSRFRPAEAGQVTSAADRRYVWFNTSTPFPELTFLFRATAWGIFTAHAYSYAEGESAFIVEASAQTWLNAGPHGVRTACEKVFEDDLSGGSLDCGEIQPRPFEEIRLTRWSSDRVVVVGDAAHTAHFSIGSGTSLAFGDAIALADAIAAEKTIQTALTRYEQLRRPVVERAQGLSAQSVRWFGTLEHRWSRLSSPGLAWSLLTRTGQSSLSALRLTDPGLAHAVEVSAERVPDSEEDLVLLDLSGESELSGIPALAGRAAMLRWDDSLSPERRTLLVDLLQIHREPAWNSHGARTVLAPPAADLDWANGQRLAGRAQSVVSST